MCKVLRLLIILTGLCSSVQSAKILVFICQKARSHHIVFHPVIRGLAARGHHVDYFTHYPMANPPKTLTQILFPLDLDKSLTKMIENTKFEQPILPQFYYTRGMRSFKVANFQEDCYKSEDVRDLLASNKTYDVVIGEFYMMQEDFSFLIHKFNASGVSIISLPDSHVVNEFSGLPSNPSYMIPFGSGNTDVMPFLERLRNFLDITLSTVVDYYSLVYPIQKFANERIVYEGWESRPSLTRMASDMALILVNNHHSLGYSYPTAPHVKQVLGTNIDYSPSPLPPDLEKFMDGAEHGIVYFSLGTLVSLKVLQNNGGYEPILKVLSNLKQKVIWKWTSMDERPPEVPNIKFSDWLPQQSILAHNKTKLFITHGGLGGLTEATFHGVPMIAVPVFGDQQKNVKLITKLRIGIELQIGSLTEAKVEWAVGELLNNPKYKEEALKRSAIFRDRPMKPVDEAVYWIEYVLRHGKVLQPFAVQMPYYQLYLLDVIGFTLAVATLVFLALRYLIRKSRQILVSALFSKKKGKLNRGHLDSKKRK